MNRRRFVLLGLLGSFAACEGEVADPAPAGLLALVVMFDDGVASAHVDLGRVTIEGPTRLQKDIAPGATDTITGLAPGVYTVYLEGMAAGEVALFGQRGGVEVRAGVNTPVSILLSSFVPEVGALPAAVGAGEEVRVEFSPVSGAVEYDVRWADNPAFSDPESVTITDTSATITPGPAGRYIIRVRARNGLGSNGRHATLDPLEVLEPHFSPNLPYLAAGQLHTCGLTASGEARCWGANESGQLGTGNTTDALEPVAVQGARSYVAVTAGVIGRHTCALERSGRAWCWGLNNWGQLGTGTTQNSATARRVAGNLAFADIATGAGFSCGVTPTGEAFCWGVNEWGQLGSGGGAPSSAPVPVGGLPPVTGITAGSFHACAWTATGAAYCWGRGLFGRLGDGDPGEGARTPRPVLDVSDFVRLRAGNATVCGVTAAGKAYCWGAGFDGRLGTGDAVNRSVPTPVAAIAGVAEIATGGLHGCAVTLTGEAHCWGYWGRGGVGSGVYGFQPEPVRVLGGPTTAAAVSAGESYACATAAGSSAGPAWCWGFGDAGRLGTGEFRSEDQPRAIQGGHALRSISAGPLHACGVTSSFDAVCWGDGTDGKLGTGSTDLRVSPEAVASGLTFTQVTAGRFNTCGLIREEAARIACWGRGRVGDGTTAERLTPVVLPDLADMASVSAGAQHTCAVSVAGQIYCWGEGSEGQLGDGTTQNRLRPTQVTGVQTMVAVSAGSRHTCALGEEGQAYCWGHGNEGQLGQGASASSPTPVAVAGGIAFLSVSAGDDFTCAVAVDGRGYCWGHNEQGQLGNGSYSNANSPVEVAGGLRFLVDPGEDAPESAIQAGSRHTCGLTNGGQLYCWGSRSFGALGDGKFPVYLQPVPVGGGIRFGRDLM